MTFRTNPGNSHDVQDDPILKYVRELLAAVKIPPQKQAVTFVLWPSQFCLNVGSLMSVLLLVRLYVIYDHHCGTRSVGVRP